MPGKAMTFRRLNEKYVCNLALTYVRATDTLGPLQPRRDLIQLIFKLLGQSQFLQPGHLLQH